MAAAHLLDSTGSCEFLEQSISASKTRILESMIAKRVNCPPTSSIGRLFDAVASLVRPRDRVTYEGQAAVELEWLAAGRLEGGYDEEGRQPSLDETGEPIVIDTRPLVAAILSDAERQVAPSIIASRFHAAVVNMIVRVCERIRAKTQLAAVVLSGGVFMNVLILEHATQRLESRGFRVFRHRSVPPNDGGLSLGQLAIAAARLALPI